MKQEDSSDGLGQILIAKLRAAFAEIMAMREQFLQNPEPAENIHNMRIALRTYKSLLSLLKPFLELTIYQDIQSLLRKPTQPTARLREIDVLIKMIEERLSAKAQTVDALTKTDKRGLKLLGEAFKVRRLEEQRYCVEKTASTAFVDDLQAANDLLLNQLNSELLEKLNMENLILPRLDAWFLSMLHRMEDYREFKLGYIHRTRLKAKKARYVSELFEEHLNEKYLRRMKEAKALQGELGDICDVINHQILILEILFPMTSVDDERTASKFENEAAIKRAAKRLILAEKELELSYRETLSLKLWLSSVGPI